MMSTQWQQLDICGSAHLQFRHKQNHKKEQMKIFIKDRTAYHV